MGKASSKEIKDGFPIVESSNSIVRHFYKPLNFKNNEIRVLVVDTADEDPAKVRCTLNTISLDEVCDYVALSYVWGTDGKTSDIVVNEQIVHVTTNLALALTCLRTSYRTEGRLKLWVDAICIRQSDLTERAEQVQIMRQIYRKAKEVAIWLGPEIPNAPYLFDLVKAAVNELREFEPQGSRSRNDMRQHFVHGDHGFLDDCFGSVPIDKRCQYLQVLVDFLSIDWFKRIWTVQEAVLNKKVTLHMMLLMIKLPTMELLCTAVGLLDTCKTMYAPDPVNKELPSSSEAEGKKLTQLKRIILNRRTHSMDALLTAQIFADNNWKSEYFTRLVQRYIPLLFENCARRLATDERDKIFALLGLMSEDVNIMADYSASATVERVYEKATFALLEWTGSLDLLYKCFPSSSPKMPSWVLDFRSRTGYGYQNPERNDSESLFNSSLNVKPFMSNSRADVLDINGRVVDRVRTTLRLGVINTPSQTKAAIDQVVQFLSPGCKDITALAIGEQHQFWRLLCGGAFENEETFYFRNYLDKDGELFGREYGAMEMPGYIDQRLVCDRIGEVLRNRVVFCTDTHRHGVGRVDIVEGDELFLLQGAEMPCVLRPSIATSRKTYRFIGGCYVDGIMHGEVVSCLPEYDPRNGDWTESVFEAISSV